MVGPEVAGRAETSSGPISALATVSRGLTPARVYDANGNVTHRTERDFQIAGSDRLSVFTFDGLDRETASEDPELNTITRTYDPIHRHRHRGQHRPHRL
jgi:hypothetical protein